MGSKPIGISASRGAGVLGISKYGSQVASWLKIMESRKPGFCDANGYKMEDFVYGAPLELGHLFEDPIIELAERESGDQILQREALYVCKPDDYITCHIDGMFQRKKCIHEGKTAQIFVYRDDWGEPGTDQIPRDYQAQVQHQMLCTGADRAIVSVLVFPVRQDDIIAATAADDLSLDAWVSCLYEMGMFHQYEVERNDEAIAVMTEVYREFWNKNVLEAIEPEITTYDDVKRIFQGVNGTIVASKEIEMLSHEFKALGAEERTLKKQKDQIKVEIIKWAKSEASRGNICIDGDSAKKLVIKSRDGFNLHSYNKGRFSSSRK